MTPSIYQWQRKEGKQCSLALVFGGWVTVWESQCPFLELCAKQSWADLGLKSTMDLISVSIPVCPGSVLVHFEARHLRADSLLSAEPRGPHTSACPGMAGRVVCRKPRTRPLRYDLGDVQGWFSTLGLSP